MLRGERRCFTAVSLIRVVLTVIVSVTDVSRVGADARPTLELAWPALELSYRESTQTETHTRIHTG